jgi:hypothetical protein
MDSKERGSGCKGLGRNKRNHGHRIYTLAEGQWVDPAKRQVNLLHLMLLPNRSLKTCTYRHVSIVRSITAYHAAHYRAVFASLLNRCTPIMDGHF